MCYAKPGPRCSRHAKKIMKKTGQAQLKASQVYLDAYNKAVEEEFIIPDGFYNAENKDELEATRILSRPDVMAALAKRTEADLTHKDAIRNFIITEEGRKWLREKGRFKEAALVEQEYYAMVDHHDLMKGKLYMRNLPSVFPRSLAVGDFTVDLEKSEVKRVTGLERDRSHRVAPTTVTFSDGTTSEHRYNENMITAKSDKKPRVGDIASVREGQYIQRMHNTTPYWDEVRSIVRTDDGVIINGDINASYGQQVAISHNLSTLATNKNCI